MLVHTRLVCEINQSSVVIIVRTLFPAHSTGDEHCDDVAEEQSRVAGGGRAADGE